MTLSLHTDRSLIRAQAESTRYILARINAPSTQHLAPRTLVNVGLVLDRSGSMADGRKFDLARSAVEQSLKLLREEDRFSLVVYDTEVDVLARSKHATHEAKRRALEALRTIAPRGGTDLGSGWLRGCEQVSEFIEGERISRCLLLTDGLANHGMTDRHELAHHAGELRKLGVVTSTFGVGADFDERLLRDMAHEGGGNFYFIEGASQIPGILTGELGEALEVTIRDARLVVRPRGRERVELLNRFRNRRDDGQLIVELGDLVSGQELDVVVKADFPRGDEGSTSSVDVELLQAENRESAAMRDAHFAEHVVWTYASHSANDRQPRNREVDRAVAALYAARARAEATEENRAGRYDRARRVLESTARRIHRYAGDDRELNATAMAVSEDIHQYEAPMTVMQQKAAFYAAASPLKGRDAAGRARRSP